MSGSRCDKCCSALYYDHSQLKMETFNLDAALVGKPQAVEQNLKARIAAETVPGHRRRTVDYLSHSRKRLRSHQLFHRQRCDI